MGKHRLSLRKLLRQNEFPKEDSKDPDEVLKKLQIQMLRVQQGIWHSRQRAVLLLEGFDAAGKGGAIRRMVEMLDPRGVRVVPIGPPTPEEQGRHYLYRFWKRLPLPGEIVIFDRSWYGRVLVERVEKLVPRERWTQAYEEINRTEKMLLDDGIDLVKIFLAISRGEQLKRLEARVRDPYKQWKITPADIEAGSRWDGYVEAVDDMFRETDTQAAPWNLVAADHKHYTRRRVLEIADSGLRQHRKWMEKKAQRLETREMEKSLRLLEAEKKNNKGN